MTYVASDVWNTLDRIAARLDSAIAELRTVRETLADGALTKEPSEKQRCPRCGVELGPRQLAEHLANVHDDKTT